MTQISIDHLVSQDFDGAEFLERRQRIAAAIGPKASALLQGAPRPASPHPAFAQSKVFYYLCGILIERSYLLIHGEGAKSTLFVPREGICNVKGGTLDEATRSAICERMAIDGIETVDALGPVLAALDTLHLLNRPDEQIFATKFGLMGAARMRAEDPFDGHRRRDELLLEAIKAMCPKIEIAELEPIISEMRLLKSPAEIDVLRRNGRMSALACVEAMKVTAPGVPTGAFEGIAEYVFHMMGRCGQAYDFMLEPSHPESDTLLNGDLVLMDCAPDHHCYTMDIARIWPVNGVFDDWQRHTYGLILDYHKLLLNLARPGNLVGDNYNEAATQMLAKYEGDEAGTAILNNMIAKGVRYYNHHVGLSPHDAVAAWQGEPLRAGMVLTVDPMVWLDDAPHSYVRVEDTILITPDGCESLTGSAPIEIDEIEALMKQPGRFPLDL